MRWAADMIFQTRRNFDMRKEIYLSTNVLQALIIIVLVIAVAVVIYAKHGQKTDGSLPRALNNSANNAAHPGEQVDHLSATGEKMDTLKKPLPLLLDLGATKCIPCKMMAPILEELREEYRGRFEVVFIDIWENKEAISRYNVRVIPTQIFFNAGGKELFRHQGFYSKEQIIAKWKEYGINLEKQKN
jgi:thioredoxin 1